MYSYLTKTISALKKKSRKTEAILREIEDEYSVARFGFLLGSLTRFFEAKVNRDKLEIYKPEGVEGEILLSFELKNWGVIRQPMQLKVKNLASPAQKLEVPAHYLAILNEHMKLDKKNDVSIRVQCLDLGITGVLKLHLNSKYLNMKRSKY